LVIGVVVRKPRVGERPAVSHHPFLDVLTIDLASRHEPAAAVVILAAMASPGLVIGMLDEFVARCNPAGPAFALAVEAKLIGRRRVDAAESNSVGPDHHRVTFADLCGAGDVGSLCESGQQKYDHCEQELPRHAKRSVQNGMN